jgi:hypothetical protein
MSQAVVKTLCCMCSKLFLFCMQLSLSTSNAPSRAQAIAVLKTLLANPAAALSKDGKPIVDATFVRCAIQQLTSKEVLQLVDWVDLAAETPESIPWYECWHNPIIFQARLGMYSFSWICATRALCEVL